MISGKSILLAGVGLLLLSGPAGAQRLSGLPGIDRRAPGYATCTCLIPSSPFSSKRAGCGGPAICGGR